MQVFKMYFKIMKKELPSALIYGAVFLALTFVFVAAGGNSGSAAFFEEKMDIAWINEDGDTQLAMALKGHMSKKCSLVIDAQELDEENIADALFYRKVKAVVTVPKGFSEAFANGEDPLLQLERVPDAAEAINLEIAVNQFLNTAGFYRDFGGELTIEEILEKTELDLSEKTEVSLYAEGSGIKNESLVNFLNFSGYGIIAVLVMSVGTIMIAFQNLDIKRRNMVAPLSVAKFNMQLVLGNFVFTLVLLAVLAVTMLAFFPRLAFEFRLLLMLGNLFLFSLSALAISFLVGILIKKKQAMDAVTNCLSLAMSFLGGIFVPLELLDQNVQRVGSFFPTYWFVKVNNLLGSLTDFTGSRMEEIKTYMLIEFGFALVLFGIILVISKRKNAEAV